MYGASKPNGGLPYLVAYALNVGETVEVEPVESDISVDFLKLFDTRTLDKTLETPYTDLGKERFRELPETAENVRALIFNLRQHGILWYKDSKNTKAGDAPAE